MKARSMLFTLYGDSIQRYGGEIAAQSLIAVMGVLGFTPQAVRAALVRTVRQGWVQRRRVGRRSFYVLTPRGRLRVEHGTRRVYALQHRPWDRQWRILTYTFPESGRSKRDRLRRELMWLGMGPLASSTWISPYDLHDHLAAFVEAHRLQAHVAEFVAQHLGPAADRDLVARCWDLTAIARWHDDFLAGFRSRLTALRPAHGGGRLRGEDPARPRIPQGSVRRPVAARGTPARGLARPGVCPALLRLLSTARCGGH